MIASENIGAPLKLTKKKTKNPRAKKSNTQKFKQRSSISVIIVEQLDILDLIAISD